MSLESVRITYTAGNKRPGAFYHSSENCVLAALKRILVSRTFITFVGFCAVALMITMWVDSIGGYDALRQRYGLLAPTLSVFTLAVFAITPFPSDFVSIASGAMYGFWPGVLVSWLGWYLAAVIEFTIGRRSRADFPVDEWLAKLPTWLQKVPVQHPVFLICSRFIPYAGGHIATLIPGALGVHPARFAWCAAVSIVPLAFLMAGIGAGLLSLL